MLAVTFIVVVSVIMKFNIMIFLAFERVIFVLRMSTRGCLFLLSDKHERVNTVNEELKICRVVVAII